MAKVSEKGQITIPKEIRELMGIHPGDEVEFEKENGDVKLVKRADNEVFDDFVGYLGKGKSDKIMRELRGDSD